MFKRDNKNVKKLLELINRVFLIYKSNKVTVEPMQCTVNDKTIVVTLPNKHRGYFTSIFKQDEAETITDHCQRISVGILNKKFIGEHRNTKKQTSWIFCD